MKGDIKFFISSAEEYIKYDSDEYKELYRRSAFSGLIRSYSSVDEFLKWAIENEINKNKTSLSVFYSPDIGENVLKIAIPIMLKHFEETREYLRAVFSNPSMSSDLLKKYLPNIIEIYKKEKRNKEEILYIIDTILLNEKFKPFDMKEIVNEAFEALEIGSMYRDLYKRILTDVFIAMERKGFLDEEFLNKIKKLDEFEDLKEKSKKLIKKINKKHLEKKKERNKHF